MRSFSRLLSVFVAGSLTVGFVTGCAKAPDEQLAAAKTAIKAAQDAEAEKYMSKNFQNLQKALTVAETEIALQNESFILSRKYTKAKQLLNNLINLAEQIKTEAPAAKAEMKAQVEINLKAAQEIAVETRAEVKKAPRSKVKDLLEQMNADLNTSDNAIVQAATDLAADDITGAAQKLGLAQKLLKKISDQLSTGGTEGLM
jgi:hypothetical protein